MGYNETMASVEASLAQLQVDQLDLVMVHHRAADAGEWPREVTTMQAFPENWVRECVCVCENREREREREREKERKRDRVCVYVCLCL